MLQQSDEVINSLLRAKGRRGKEASPMLSRSATLIRIVLSVPLSFALIFGALPARAQNAPPKATITGTVLDQQGGLPIPGASLTLMQAANAVAHATSDVN